MDVAAGFLGTLKETLGPGPAVALLLGIVAIPFVAVIALVAGNLRLGPLAIELRRSAKGLDELSIAMAESRIAELEVAARQVLTPLNEADKRELRQHTEILKAIVTKLKSR